MIYIKHNGQWKRTTGVTIGQGKVIDILNNGQWLNNDFKPTITAPVGVTVSQPSYQDKYKARGLILSNSSGNKEVSVSFPQVLAGKDIYICSLGKSNSNMNDAYIIWSDQSLDTTALAPYFTSDYWFTLTKVLTLDFTVYFHGANSVEFGAIFVIDK